MGLGIWRKKPFEFLDGFEGWIEDLPRHLLISIGSITVDGDILSGFLYLNQVFAGSQEEIPGRSGCKGDRLDFALLLLVDFPAGSHHA